MRSLRKAILGPAVVLACICMQGCLKNEAKFSLAFDSGSFIIVNDSGLFLSDCYMTVNDQFRSGAIDKIRTFDRIRIPVGNLVSADGRSPDLEAFRVVDSAGKDTGFNSIRVMSAELACSGPAGEAYYRLANSNGRPIQLLTLGQARDT